MKTVFKSKLKCGKCRRILATHRSNTFCSGCKKYFHVKCSSGTTRALNRNGSTWKCSNCLQKQLPFSSISDENLKLALQGIEERTQLNMRLLPQFSVRSLLEKIPGQAASFDEISHKYNCSKYFEVDEFLKHNFDDSTSLGFFHMNIASLTKHHEELAILLNILKYKFKVIGISETRLTTTSSDINHLLMQEYSFINTATLSNAGGTGLFVHDFIMQQTKLRSDLCSQVLQGYECTFIEIQQTGRKNIICGCFYKHPSFPISDFIENCLNVIINKTSRENKLLVLMGDFNINLLNYDRCTGT